MARKPLNRQITAAKFSGDAPPEIAVESPAISPELAAAEVPEDRPVRVYADGIYDLFHFGHARALEQAKNLFPNTYLLVGCCNDEITHRYKGKTVMNESERYESLRHCKWVDEVIPDAPWVLNQEFIDKHKIDFVAHDSLPYADASGAGNDVYEFVKAIGKFKETKRTDGISTSDVIMRILKDYNKYGIRNLARGSSRKDLGVSFVKEKQLRVNMGITKLCEKVKEHQEKLHTVAKTAGMQHNEWFEKWVENADRWVAGFLEKFEEGWHIMETAIKDRIQERLRRQSWQRAARTYVGIMTCKYGAILSLSCHMPCKKGICRLSHQLLLTSSVIHFDSSDQDTTATIMWVVTATIPVFLWTHIS